jgi:lauroyl/myristoyl acyltransferase
MFEYHIIGPITIEKTENIDNDAKRLTQKFTSILEEEIRKTPEQWLWAHRRWLDIGRHRYSISKTQHPTSK